MIVLGTSGFSYRDWKGVFYPENMRNEDFLSFYKDYFKTVEINTTYYGIPKARVFEDMLKKTPDGFEFVIKANKVTTHELSDKTVAGEFRESILPLQEAGRLSGILAQFPWRFQNDERNRHYLSELSESYRGMTFFVEFRHKSWNCDEVFDFLKLLGLYYVSVDEPQIGNMMPPVSNATGDIAYIRFHGRNTETWWGKSGDRYDYDYSTGELEDWIEKTGMLEKKVRKIYTFFNNCHKGYAVKNALMYKDLLIKKGKKV